MKGRRQSCAIICFAPQGEIELVKNVSFADAAPAFVL
jgi:hypothetical protein